MKIKRSVALLLSMTMGIGLISGCNKEEEEVREPTTETIIECPQDNKTAMKSPTDVAVRYFYLINNGEYETARKLLDLTDTYISADLLEKMYKSVPNYSFSSSLVAVDTSMSKEEIENGGTGTVRVTYANSAQSGFVEEQSYEESDEPVWYNLTEPYVDNVTFSNVSEVDDIDNDGVITQDDMEAENSQTEPSEIIGDDFVVERTGMKTAQIRTELLAGSEVSEGSIVSESSILESDIDNEQNKSGVSANSGTFKAYNKYSIDIAVKNKNGVYYICLPSTMKAEGISLKLRVPQDMTAYINGVKLTEDLMDLDDFYIVTQLPMYPTATLTLKNKVDEPYDIKLDLTKRMCYVYDYVMPTRSCRNGALDFAGKAILQLYKSIASDESYSKSSFAKNYVSKNTKVELFKDYYDRAVLEGSLSGASVSLIEISLPPKNDTSYGSNKVYYSDFKIENGNYLTLPVNIVLSVKYNRPNYSSNEQNLISREYIDGTFYLTKDNGEWKVWSFERSLLLNSSNNW